MLNSAGFEAQYELWKHFVYASKEKAQDEKEDLQIRNTELLIEIETLEEEILRLDEHLKHSD